MTDLTARGERAFTSRTGRRLSTRKISLTHSFSQTQQSITNEISKEVTHKISEKRRCGELVYRPDVSGDTIHVNNLSLRTTEDTLKEIFGKYGQIESCKILVDPHTRESRGFAFIRYSTSADASEALTQMNRQPIDGRDVIIQKARRARERSPTPGQYMGRSKDRGYGRHRSPPRHRSSPYDRDRSYRDDRRDDRRDDYRRDDRRDDRGSRYRRSRSPDRRRDDYRRDDRDRERGDRAY
ncbi:hypothetical protein PROFUN_09234 [Planoprotostelium fungivorum]|uniref:RRM domain-containing protein n=1 Tax=Planoprotostelium fungivorum TaxID=1890364 RepID=A0A2P6NHP2_9EUKA|nr:hypothetical protein PROFUN_09234 [Planoprotostelium fungivorum]